jgi:hypothetical protein
MLIVNNDRVTSNFNKLQRAQLEVLWRIACPTHIVSNLHSLLSQLFITDTADFPM